MEEDYPNRNPSEEIKMTTGFCSFVVAEIPTQVKKRINAMEMMVIVGTGAESVVLLGLAASMVEKKRISFP